MQKILASLAICCLLFSSNLFADELALFQQQLAQKFSKAGNPLVIESVKKTAIEGFYAVQLQQGPLLYVSADLNHFFAGELYQFQANRMINITEKESALARGELMKQFNPQEMVIFAPKTPVKTKSYITVFTDVDCFYCQKLHKEVPELNARGIEVRYMGFPRAGVNSASAQKLVSAWCSNHPQEAITRLKNQQSIEQRVCDNPIAKQYELGKRMGVTGTPAIILPDGTLIPGYKPARDLAQILGV